MEALSALNLMEKFEERMFLMYDSWTRAFAGNQKAVVLFDRLKRDELAHRNLVLQQRDIVKKSNGYAGLDIKLDVRVLNRTIDIIHEATQTPPKKFRRALEITYTLESSAAEQYAFTALKDMGGDIGKLLYKYMEHFGDHYSLVLDAIRRERLSPVSPEHESLVQLRVPYAAMVTIRDGVTVAGCNISDGGLYVSTNETFDVGQEVPVRLPLPEGIINLRGVVKHTQNGKGVGIEFSGLSDAQSAGISKYIDRVMVGESVVIPGGAPAATRTKAAPKAATTTKSKPASKAAAMTKAKPAPKVQKSRVIIVNISVFSNSDIQMFVSALEDAGYMVQETANPSSVIEALADEVQDRAVLLAAETINDDAFPLLGAIKKNPAYSNIPLLVLSTSYDKKFINRVLAYGASFAHKMSLTPDKLVAFLGPANC